MKVLKKIGISLISVILAAAIIADIIYIIIYCFAPKKSTVTTFNVNVLKNVENENLKHILNLKYFRNNDNSGKECFEMQLNYLMNEEISNESSNDNLVYSKGIQLVNSTYDYCEIVDDKMFGTQKHTFKPYIFPYYLYNAYNSNSYVKDSFYSDKTKVSTAIDETDKIFQKDFFRITIGDDIFKVTFKNEVDKEPFKTHGDGILNLRTHAYYYERNAGSFIIDLYNSIKTLPAGENQAKVFEFLETFNYQKYDPDTKQYTDILTNEDADYTLITQHLISYYAIKIDIYEEGITKASQSLFNCVNGQFNFNLTDEPIADDYFVGANKIKLNENCFDYQLDSVTNKFYPILKECYKNKYNQFKEVEIELEFDLTYLQSLGVNDLVIYEDKLNFGNLKLYKAVKNLKNSSGEITSTEVIYVY